jgi:SAM-dependent methyltransferase
MLFALVNTYYDTVTWLARCPLRPGGSGPGWNHEDMPQTSKAYLHGHHDSVLRSHRWRTAENSAAYLLPWLTPAARVLDVGCGPGTITVDLAAQVPAGLVTGIDAAAEALTDARAEAARRDQRNVTFDVGDVRHLGFDDAAFDVVHAHQVLQHLTDPVAALAEMRRVCRPGGVVAARDGDYGGFLWFPEDPELAEWRTLYQRVARATGGEPDAGRRMIAWARRAGFTDVRASASVWLFSTPEERSWWGGLWADRLTQSAFGEHAIGHGLATRSDLRRLAGAWHRWASSEDGWFLIPHGEILCRA